jgi:hypothetical protein
LIGQNEGTPTIITHDSSGAASDQASQQLTEELNRTEEVKHV